MKANRKSIFEADDHAVSAVIGVILMVAVTVAIAAIVYIYVSDMIITSDNLVVCGEISELPSDKDSTGILKMDGKIYIVENIGGTEYMLMQYAFVHGCNCTLVLMDSMDTNVYWVQGGSVSLLDCGCDN